MKQIKVGKVVSIKMQNTAVVEVQTRKKHPLYKKIITKTKRIKAKNDKNVQLGQTVKIVETRPISKDVHFTIMEVIK